MASSERSMSRDRTGSPGPKQKHSFPELGKIHVPMWDSSDPDRNPPPLPLNPTSSNASPSRANASTNIAAAAQALADRARESAGPAPYVKNGMLQAPSPDRSPTRAAHKRLQSLHPNFRDLRASLENTSSRPTTPSSPADWLNTPDRGRSPSRLETPTPTNGKDLLKDTPNLRPSRNMSILGRENTPPSATMLAIQNMPRRSSETTPTASPLADITNGSVPTSRAPDNMSNLYLQMQTLTSIATTLKQEMAQLSRRSKDNATDLVSLKEATKSRDEDIKKHLKELVMNARASDLGPSRGEMSRSTSALDFTPRFLDVTPKSVSLPRITPVEEEDRATSPSPYSVQGASTMSMLEKIVREMGTKEGQQRLISTLSDMLDKSGKESAETARKVEELVQFIRDKSTSQALVKHNGTARNLAEEPSTPTKQTQNRSSIAPGQQVTPSASSPVVVNVLNDELRQFLYKLKDSVSAGGGLTNEVKGLVRDLRGEVLGMGRELGRRLDNTNQSGANDRAMVLAEPGNSNEHLMQVIQEGLAELKEQMEQVIQTKRRQSSGSALSRGSIEGHDVYALVKKSLEEQGVDASRAVAGPAPAFDYDKIVGAVTEAFESHPFEPEVRVEYLGLDRDEILQCLRQGLEDYQKNRSVPETSSVSRDDIPFAVQEGMQHFSPPKLGTELDDLKEELTLAVKDCLDEIKREVPRSSSRMPASEISRDDILEAVRDGLGVFKREGAREIDINREDLFEAVRTGLDNLGYGDEVLQSLHDIVERVRVEFKEYSAANGRDTELVLDATRDGLESLRANIETYVDRSRDVLGKDEVIGELRSGLSSLHETIKSFSEQSSRDGDNIVAKTELVDYIKSEFEHLHGVMADGERGRSTDRDSISKEHIIAALTAGVAELKAGLGNREFEGPTEEVLDAMKEEFEQLQDAVLKGTAAQKNELLEAIQDNLGNLSTDRGMGGSNEDLVVAMKEEFDSLRASLQAPVLHTGPSMGSSGEVREAVQQGLDDIRVRLAADRGEANEDMMRNIRDEIGRLRETMNSQVMPAATPDDRVVILEAIQASLNELKVSNFRVESEASSQGLDSVRQELEALRASVGVASASKDTLADPSKLHDTVRSEFAAVRGQLDMVQERHQESSNGHEAAAKEILETLKDGITSLRGELLQAKMSTAGSADRGVVLADEEGQASPAPTTMTKEDLDRFEVALTRLHIKVEAMDQNILASAATQSQDVEKNLTGISTMVAGLQASVAGLASREDTTASRSADGVSKEDTDALETLLQNTKAKIDDEVIPGLRDAATRDDIQTVEAVVRLMSEAVDGLAAGSNGKVASKDDVAAVYLLLEQANASLKDLHESSAASKDHITGVLEEKLAVLDTAAVAELCRDIQSSVDDLPTTNELATRADVDDLVSLIKDFRSIHKDFKQQYETDLEITARAFDDRKTEAASILGQLDDIKDSIAHSKEDLKSRLKRSNEDVRAIDEILQGIEDKIDAVPDTTLEVQEILEVLKLEFEQAHSNSGELKSGHDKHFELLSKKHDDARTALLEEITKKMDDRFKAVMDKHDAQQTAVEEATRAVNSKAVQQEELLRASRAMAEELKLTIDTLGSSVTEISPALKEATDRMGDDAKTVFGKVDDVQTRLETDHLDVMTQHELTRQDLSKSAETLGSLHQSFAAFHPRALETLTTLLALANEHFEHAKQAGAQPNVDSIHDTIKSSLASHMPRLLAAPAPSVPEAVDGKLDQLLGHAREAEKHSTNLSKLDEIQQQVQATAVEVSAFVALQTRSLTDAHEDKQEEARKATADLERANEQKQQMESIMINLAEEKTNLSATVEALREEREALSSQKNKLSAELSSVETALRIRREEMEMMDARADALERRIIQGVMDHSRALLIAKQPRAPANMNLKRVTSNASNASAVTATPSTASSALNLALNKKSGVKKPNTVSGDRRIHSLSQITGNAAPSRGVIAPVPRSGAPTGFANLKRSQSVRNPALRKASWAGQGSLVSEDKENADLSEEEEDEDGVTNSDSYSRPPTSFMDRASSYSGTHTSSSDRRTSGPSSSEYSYTTGSYLTGSDLSSDRRTSSYGSTIHSSMVGVGSSLEGLIHEEDEGEDHPVVDVTALQLAEPSPGLRGGAAEEDYEASDVVAELVPASPEDNKKPLTINTKRSGYDSGLGSDLPTAALTYLRDTDEYFPGRRES